MLDVVLTFAAGEQLELLRIEERPFASELRAGEQLAHQATAGVGEHVELDLLGEQAHELAGVLDRTLGQRSMLESVDVAPIARVQLLPGGLLPEVELATPLGAAGQRSEAAGGVGARPVQEQERARAAGVEAVGGADALQQERVLAVPRLARVAIDTVEARALPEQPTLDARGEGVGGELGELVLGIEADQAQAFDDEISQPTARLALGGERARQLEDVATRARRLRREILA